MTAIRAARGFLIHARRFISAEQLARRRQTVTQHEADERNAENQAAGDHEKRQRVDPSTRGGTLPPLPSGAGQKYFFDLRRSAVVRVIVGRLSCEKRKPRDPQPVPYTCRDRDYG